ncbi:type II secretion system F family protein [Gordonia sp. DT30]|uniref:type II secretion system F family protein n=1 Tax=unclassified Gordonia (in: high G+C Gram-positive bacteria) TaxID=2657482 RepID=UPI003CF58832
MTAILLAAACAVLCSGRSRAGHRLRAFAGSAAGPARTTVPRMLVVPAALGGALLVGGVAALCAAGVLVSLYLWRIRRRRRTEDADSHRDDLLTALSLMIAELSVGAPPARACAAAAAEMSDGGTSGRADSVAAALAMLAGRAELGGSVIAGEVIGGSGLTGGGEQSWHRIAIAWQTSETYGLPLAELLGSVRADMVARKTFTERTRAGMAGPRATAAVLAGLPLLGVALGQATGARPLSTLLGGGIGGILLVVGTVLVAAGVVWSERIAGKVLSS